MNDRLKTARRPFYLVLANREIINLRKGKIQLVIYEEFTEMFVHVLIVNTNTKREIGHRGEN